MALNEIEQLNKLLAEKKHMLITFRKEGNGDSIGGALALFLFLKKIGKTVDIVCDNFNLPKNLKFLKNSENIKSSFEHLQKFIISIDIKETGLKELSYDTKDDRLRLFITPKQGFLTKENIRTAQSDFKYDLIFVLDTPDLESLGSIYDSNTELFFKKTIINIDHSTGNEHFGQLNFIDFNASSTSEIVYNIIDQIGREHIDADTATSILTGMIAKTKSFKTLDIKPYTLDTAGKLINLGANRDYIVQNLYRTRSIATLKLWGQVLSHLQYNKDIGLVWSSITKEDFTRSGAVQEDLNDVIGELIINSPEAKMIMLLNEDKNDQNLILGRLHSEKDYHPLEILQKYEPQGNKKMALFKIEGKTLKQAEEELIEQIKKTVA